MRILSIFIALFLFSSCSSPFLNSIIYKKQEVKTPKKSSKTHQESLIVKDAKVNTNIINLTKEEKKQDIKKEVKQESKKSIPIKNIKLPYKKIAFVGDSHFASDYISAYFRNALGIHSLGFIPAILPKWHNQYLAKYNNSGFKVEYLINTKDNLSFSGINANCLDNCEINIDLGFMANNIEYLEFKSGIWNFKNYKKNTNKINFKLSSSKIGGFLSNNSSYIDNLGINGASIFNYLRIDDELAFKVAKKLDYDLVVFSFGTNESVSNKINQEMFLNNYKKIINIFKSTNTKIILLIPPEPTLYVNKNYVKGENNELVRTLIKKVAKENGAYIFNIDELMQKEGGKVAWIANKKSLKNTHLSKLGYDYVALKLLEFLKITKD